METKETNRESYPMLWYWSQPESGISIEDCENIVREMTVEKKSEGLRNLHILFV